MSDATADFALLTVVPEEHLISGLETCKESGKVTYGTDAISVLSTFQNLLNSNLTADLFIYASYAGGAAYPKTTFQARFEDWLPAMNNGTAPSQYAKYRPSSTKDDGPWQSFYIVSGLKILPSPLDIRLLKARGSLSCFNKGFFPRGPMIIDNPN